MLLAGCLADTIASSVLHVFTLRLCRIAYCPTAYLHRTTEPTFVLYTPVMGRGMSIRATWLRLAMGVAAGIPTDQTLDRANEAPVPASDLLKLLKFYCALDAEC